MLYTDVVNLCASNWLLWHLHAPVLGVLLVADVNAMHAFLPETFSNF